MNGKDGRNVRGRLLVGLALSIALVATGLVVVQAHAHAAPMADVAVEPGQGGGVAVCIVQDKTRSTEGTGIPQLDPVNLLPLVDVVKQAGGEIALAIVREASNRPLARLYIPPPPAAAIGDDASTNIITRARDGQRAERDHQARVRTWNEVVERDVQVFLKEAATRLGHTADAPATDLWSALRRCDTFLSEPERVRTQRWVVAITDGIDTVGRNPRPLESGAPVLLVPGTTIGSLAMLNPRTFESPVAAFRSIAASTGRRP